MTQEKAERPPTTEPVAGVTLLYLLKQVELAVRSNLEDVTGAHGLTSLQYTALTVLERRQGLTSAALARNSFVRPQTMAQMITVLEDRRLIRRDKDPVNRRQYLLSLTELGQQALDFLRVDVEALEARMVSGLDEPEIAAMRLALRSCRLALGGRDPH
ncbi:MAG: MarR family transcriptional regulator [Pseudolysinimonas sp.]